MKETNYKKKEITGKRTHLILSKEAYLALKSQKEKLGYSNTTQYIESLLLLTHNKNNDNANIFENANKLYDKITNLINFNKKIYLDLNATFSNINQIAYKLNLAHLNGELDSLNTKEIEQDIKQTLSQTKEYLMDLKVISKHIISLLESKQKTLQNLTKGAKNGNT